MSIDPSREDREFQLLVEACRLSEKNLENEIAIALAADQRAASFCGLIVASIAILVGLSENIRDSVSLTLSVGAFALSAVFAGAATRSVKVHAPGFKFDDFSEDISQARAMKDVLKDIGRHYDAGSKINRNVISRNARLFNFSLLLAAAGLAFALLSFVGGGVEP